MTEQAVKEQCCSNGLTVSYLDVSSHYYGGYWKVAVEARCLVPLSSLQMADDGLRADYHAKLGDQVPFVSRLEQMAVPMERLDTVREELLCRLERQVTALVTRDRFAERFVAAEYAKRSTRTVRGIPCLL